MEKYCKILTLLGVVGICFLLVTSAQEDVTDLLKDLLTKKKTLYYIKTLIQDVDNSLESLRKRSCGAFSLPGMNCDLVDLKGISQDQDHWENGMTPGRRQTPQHFAGRVNVPSKTHNTQRRSCKLGTPGNDCILKDVLGGLDDQDIWKDGFGPGKK
ncbi:uncharacterized protein LOC111083847 [Limulus polyphemus]|uniref:Uncharacterized protein LOC111083847 n=1 Tax=Limulus polyphemus TaxID=6850 RepID=A0ABM1RY04_LIMPO|nr:uncharacterized protein LOC111083847 [Limulus polyphemus]